MILKVGVITPDKVKLSHRLFAHLVKKWEPWAIWKCSCTSVGLCRLFRASFWMGWGFRLIWFCLSSVSRLRIQVAPAWAFVEASRHLSTPSPPSPPLGEVHARPYQYLTSTSHVSLIMWAHSLLMHSISCMLPWPNFDLTWPDLPL